MPAASNSATSELYIGMLSGTSRDGADLALVAFRDDGLAVQDTLCERYPDSISAELADMIDAGRQPGLTEAAHLHRNLAVFFASCVAELLAEAGVDPQDVTAIGSHGQTVWHDPKGTPPASIQLGDPQVIAERTGIVTVGDFRRADLRAGGEGAPLAPLLHRALFRPKAGRRVVLNLGGIANVSLIDAGGHVSGFDTGPGNCLLDAWIRRRRQLDYDDRGLWAARGKVILPLLTTLLEDRWFGRPPPKSTGVETFNLRWLEQAADLDAFAPVDIQATLSELTARSVARAIGEQTSEILVCGGGVHNTDLLERLQAWLPGCTIESTIAHGLDPDAVEAVLFAWLARERLAERPQDTTSITGAEHLVLLGSVFHPDGES